MNEEINNMKGREFICSCGKNYLSYAALFTHIKQKHDGKAPGPIVRPRSQRKRGRPRKNPQGQNEPSSSDSDKAQNGISKLLIDNNNIEQKQQEQEKTKKAAQELGCGGFVAFTAYKPEPIRPSPKKTNESGKKNMSRKGSSYTQVVERKVSLSQIPLQQKQSQIKIPIVQSNSSIHQREKTQMLSYYQKIEISNRQNLKKIFQSHLVQFSTSISLIKQKQLQIFKQIQVNFENPQKSKTRIEQMSIAQGISQFLYEVKSIINEDQQDTRIIDSKQNSNEDNVNASMQKEQENQIQFEQILLIIAFLLKFIVEQGPYGANELQQKSIMEIAEYLPKFALAYLPMQIKSFHVDSLDIFKMLNPTNFLLFLDNWLVIRKKIQQINNKIQINHHDEDHVVLQQDNNKQNEEKIEAELKEEEYKDQQRDNFKFSHEQFQVMKEQQSERQQVKQEESQNKAKIEIKEQNQIFN